MFLRKSTEICLFLMLFSSYEKSLWFFLQKIQAPLNYLLKPKQIPEVMKKSEYKESICKNKNILINLTLETFLVYSRHQT